MRRIRKASLRHPMGEDGRAFLERILRNGETLEWFDTVEGTRLTVGLGPAFPTLAAERSRRMQLGVSSRRLFLLDPYRKTALHLVVNLIRE